MINVDLALYYQCNALGGVRMANGDIISISESFDFNTVPIGTRVEINKRYAVVLNSNGHGRCYLESDDQCNGFGLNQTNYGCYSLHWVSPHVVPKYVVQKIYRIILKLIRQSKKDALGGKVMLEVDSEDIECVISALTSQAYRVSDYHRHKLLAYVNMLEGNNE